MRTAKISDEQAARSSMGNINVQDLIDGTSDELVVIDSKYRIRSANSLVRRTFQHGAASPIGRSCHDVLHQSSRPCVEPLWSCPLKNVIQGGHATIIPHSTRDTGVERHLLIGLYPIRDRQGNPKAVVEVRRDVTAERNLERQILRRHHQVSVVSRISHAVSSLNDLDTILSIGLDGILELIGGDIGGILLVDEESRTLKYRTQRGLSSRYADEMCMNIGEGIAGEVALTGEPILLEDISKDPRVIRPDLVSTEGLKAFVSIPLNVMESTVGVINVASCSVGEFTHNDIILLTSIGEHIGIAIEQTRLYKRLAKAGERYQTLLQRALSAQEDERKRIARELHDETSQSLTSLTLNLQALITMAEMGGFKDEEFITRLKTTHSYAVHAGSEIVNLMKELRPTLLDELGMPAAINRYAKDTLEARGIGVSVEFQGTEDRLPSEIEVTLYRIAQGLIGNILEHSGAKNALIKLVWDNVKCSLRIEDDGKGFDVSKLTRVDPSGRGAGLFTLKERAKLVGGRCNIDSRPGQGTRVNVTIPIAHG